MLFWSAESYHRIRESENLPPPIEPKSKQEKAPTPIFARYLLEAYNTRGLPEYC